jgi:hypothetical protein
MSPICLIQLLPTFPRRAGRVRISLCLIVQYLGEVCIADDSDNFPSPSLMPRTTLCYDPASVLSASPLS